jgi:uncharacterized repeat protein (TIGR03803 family)
MTFAKTWKQQGADTKRLALAAATVFLFVLAGAHTANAQTFQVIHTFTGADDGAHPFAGLAIDRGGHLYGVASSGGNTGVNCGATGCGTAFRMANRGAGWGLTPLYSFQGPPDGNDPAGVVIGPDGLLYGTTSGGGTGIGNQNCLPNVNGCGIVFRLQPPANACTGMSCPWNESVLYRFTGQNGDGGGPYNGDLVFDAAGNIYGTTEMGGTFDYYGTVYKLAPGQSGWTESILHAFVGVGAEANGNPQSGVVFDQNGNLYGTTTFDTGTTYQLALSGGRWLLTVLHGFNCLADGCGPAGGVIFDSNGNLFGTTSSGGPNGSGGVYELLPSQNWFLTPIYGFSGGGSLSKLTMDAAGNFYGSTEGGAHGQGSIFKLSHNGSGWTYTDLHDFTGGADGGQPHGGIAIDSNGNLYGTAAAGGSLSSCQNGCGVVWEITP